MPIELILCWNFCGISISVFLVYLRILHVCFIIFDGDFYIAQLLLFLEKFT